MGYADPEKRNAYLRQYRTRRIAEDPDFRRREREKDRQRRAKDLVAYRERKAAEKARRAERRWDHLPIEPSNDGKWTPLPVGTEVAVPPARPTVYLCSRNGPHATKHQADHCSEGHYNLSPSLPTRYT